MLITTRVKNRRIVVGELKNRVFGKNVKKSKHLMRKYDSFGFDYGSLVNTILPNSDLIVIHETEEGKYYAAKPKTFGRFEGTKYIPSPQVLIRRYNKRREEGVQVFLPRRHWFVVDNIDDLKEFCESSKTPNN